MLAIQIYMAAISSTMRKIVYMIEKIVYATPKDLKDLLTVSSRCPRVIFTIYSVQAGSLSIGVTGQVKFIVDFNSDQDGNDLLLIQVIYLGLFWEILELDELIMKYRQRVIPRRRRRRATVIWVGNWVRRREDRGQYHILTAELYQEEQVTFNNFRDFYRD